MDVIPSTFKPCLSLHLSDQLFHQRVGKRAWCLMFWEGQVPCSYTWPISLVAPPSLRGWERAGSQSKSPGGQITNLAKTWTFPLCTRYVLRKNISISTHQYPCQFHPLETGAIVSCVPPWRFWFHDTMHWFNVTILWFQMVSCDQVRIHITLYFLKLEMKYFYLQKWEQQQPVETDK